MAADEEARARARRRASWPGKLTRLGETDDAALMPDATPEERLQALAEVSRRAWALAGYTGPTYDRANIPGRLIRRG